MNDIEFIKAFESGEFSPAEFNHRAHIRLAWAYLDRFDEETAISKTCNAIKNFDGLHGDGTKYHKTLTVASVKVVHHFRQKSNASTFDGFVTEHPRLISSFKDLLLQHYGETVFISPKSKTTYIEPDLLPFT
ncbi:hypothetical protein GUA46_07210 [Muricauda sp. HICW]|uniref:Uncharacterized protein n=1 Tax=Flagellimonas chongwuensis TaxID=2697365 RepID=A0A850NDQ1_9FLAO|nr:hypothetical protein [Allomuricauda chongwuensis]NVN18124.1 hypothetical protein [Allomuricauda chongwuensis]